MVNLNRFGVVTALEYVGATADRNYISEVWRHEIPTNKYKYRYLPPVGPRACTGNGGDGPTYKIGDYSWGSEECEDAVPPERFFSNFKPAARTFFINCSSGTFMQGPDFGALRTVLHDSGKLSDLTKYLIESISIQPQDWMQMSASMIADNSGFHHSDHGPHHKRDCLKTEGPAVEKIQKAQLFQFALGLTVARMISGPPV